MELNFINFTTKGIWGITHHNKVVATLDQREEALAYVAKREGIIVKDEVEEVAELIREQHTTYFMDGLKTITKTSHFQSGTTYTTYFVLDDEIEKKIHRHHKALQRSDVPIWV